MGRLGFEPRTIRLKAEYSTVELATQITASKDTVYQHSIGESQKGRWIAHNFRFLAKTDSRGWQKRRLQLYRSLPSSAWFEIEQAIACI